MGYERAEDVGLLIILWDSNSFQYGINLKRILILTYMIYGT